MDPHPNLEPHAKAVLRRRPAGQLRFSLAGLGCLAVALAYAYLAPATYEARARVSVKVVAAVADMDTSPAALAARLREVALSHEAFDGIAKQEGDASPEAQLALAQHVQQSFEVREDSAGMFTLAFEEGEPERAARLCNQLAEYAVAHLGRGLGTGSRAIGGVPEVGVQASPFEARIVESAGVPSTPKSPNRPLLIALGTFFGLLLAVFPSLGRSPRGARQTPEQEEAEQSLRTQQLEASRVPSSPRPFVPRASLGGFQSPAFTAAVDALPSPRSFAESPPPASAEQVPTRKSTRIFGSPVAATSARPALPSAPAAVPSTPVAEVQAVAEARAVVVSSVAPRSGSVFKRQALHWSLRSELEPDARNELCDAVLARIHRAGVVIGVTAVPEVETEKSRVAVELALLLSHIREPRVLLVDGNFLRAQVHRLLGLELPMARGLSAQLQAQAASESLSWYVAECTPTLHVLAEGPIRSPGAILSHEFERCIAAARAEYDLVIIDGPPLSAEVDCLAMVEVIDAAVVVVPAATLAAPEEEAARELLAQKSFVLTERV